MHELMNEAKCAMLMNMTFISNYLYKSKDCSYDFIVLLHCSKLMRHVCFELLQENEQGWAI